VTGHTLPSQSSIKYGSHKVWLRNWKLNFDKSWQKN
jgi:hypothetical protein